MKPIQIAEYAAMARGKCLQYCREAHGWWEWTNGTGAPFRTAALGESRARVAVRSFSHYMTHSGIVPQIACGLLITTAILAATYLAAANLVDGAASHSSTRTSRTMGLQQAAVNYRLARAQCQRVAAPARGACIAEAHAEEDRARAMLSLAPPSQVASFRSSATAAIDAGDRDSIVIEPACTVVLRGQASICEIQVNSNSTNVLAAASSRG